MNRLKPVLKVAVLTSSLFLVGALVGYRAGAFTGSGSSQFLGGTKSRQVVDTPLNAEGAQSASSSESDNAQDGSKLLFMAGSKSDSVLTGTVPATRWIPPPDPPTALPSMPRVPEVNAPSPPPTPAIPPMMPGPKSAPVFVTPQIQPPLPKDTPPPTLNPK
jgi:hypothetical protein